MNKEYRAKVVQLLSRMEDFAVKNRFKARVLDAVSDCRERWSEETPGQGLPLDLEKIEELVGQFEEQLKAVPEEERVQDEARRRGWEIWNRCRNENMVLQKQYCGSSETSVQEAERKLYDLANVRANFDDVVDAGRFQEKVNDVANAYKRQIDELQGSYIGEVGDSYTAAFDRMRKLFSGVGQPGVSVNRIFYEKYTENQDGLVKAAESYAQSLDKGEKRIAGFAESMRDSLREKIDDLKRKRKIRKLIPPIVLLAVLLAVLTFVILTAKKFVENMAQVVLPEDMTQLLLDNLGTIINLVKEMRGGKTAVAGAGVVVGALPILLLFYFFWCKAVNKAYRRWVTEEAGRLLNGELDNWKQQNCLQKAVQESYQELGRYMETQYEGILSGMLPAVLPSDDPGTGEEIRQIRSDWEKLKREGTE